MMAFNLMNFTHTTYLCKNTMTNVGTEMTMYKCDQLLKNMDNPGNIINPIDQKKSNKTSAIVFALPPVISTTKELHKFY